MFWSDPICVALEALVIRNKKQVFGALYAWKFLLVERKMEEIYPSVYHGDCF